MGISGGDIVDCKTCDHRGPAIRVSETEPVQCEECGSIELRLFMKKPTKNQIKSQQWSLDKESWLEEQDPEWRTRFRGDIDSAIEFYRN